MTTQGATAATGSAGVGTGAELLRSLDDGRQVFVDGERVGKVIEHPAFREAARSLARLLDIAAAPELRERMTYPSPKNRQPGRAPPAIPRPPAGPPPASRGCSTSPRRPSCVNA